MSLIQEALKRQQEEAQAQGPEKKAPPPSPDAQAPADAGDGHRRIGLSRQAPASVQAQQQEGGGETDPANATAADPAAGKRSHAWALAAALLAVLALMTGLVLGAYYAYQKWGGGAAAEPPADAEPAQTSESDFIPVSPGAGDATAAPSATGALSTAAAPATNLPATGTSPSNEVAATNGATAMSVPAGGLSRLLSIPRTQRPDEKPDLQTAPTMPAHDAASTSAPTTTAAVTQLPSEWPLVTVGGFLGGGKHGSVILNGEIKAVGETIMDVEITAIESRGVVLRYMGQTKVLKMGQSTQ